MGVWQPGEAPWLLLVARPAIDLSPSYLKTLSRQGPPYFNRGMAYNILVEQIHYNTIIFNKNISKNFKKKKKENSLEVLIVACDIGFE